MAYEQPPSPGPGPNMWHLNQDPYLRGVPKEHRDYVPVRNSYAPPSQAAYLDRRLAHSLDDIDSPSTSYRPPYGANGTPAGVGNARPASVVVGGSSKQPRPPRAGRRPVGGIRMGGRGGTTSQSDFVFVSPNRPPSASLTPKHLAVPEEDDDSEDERPPARSRERKPFLRDQDDHRSMGRKCRDCMTRVPYATLIATVMCCVGVGVFCGTMYRGTTLTLRLFDDVFRINITWVEPVQLTFMIVGAGMGGLGLMILFVGCLSTGDTRNKVYRTWRGRVGGRISCAIFMGISYLLSLAWLLMLGALVIVVVFYVLAWFQCQEIPVNECIDYNQFSFLFPPGTPEEDMRVCHGERKLFCKDYVNNAVIMFILATVASFLVILSLVHYLMCLAANYAHIKDQEKFMDLQEIQFLHESEMSTLPKDRF